MFRLGGRCFCARQAQGPSCPSALRFFIQVVSIYNLTLQVADMSGEGLATTATAVIYVDDINDSPPEFTQEEVGNPPRPPPRTGTGAEGGACQGQRSRCHPDVPDYKL